MQLLWYTPETNPSSQISYTTVSVSQVLKNPSTDAADPRVAGSIPGSGRSPGGRHGNPLQYSRLENPHGQRSLVGYSPWGRRESDSTAVT